MLKYTVDTKLYLIQNHIDGLVQERRNSIADALELSLSCTKPSIYIMYQHWKFNSWYHINLVSCIENLNRSLTRYCVWNDTDSVEVTSATTDGAICVLSRHRENFWAFTGLTIDFGLILLISNMIIHRSFTGPTHLLSANVQGPVSFVVSVLEEDAVVSWGLYIEFAHCYNMIRWNTTLQKPMQYAR